jgi:hypothetical protein
MGLFAGKTSLEVSAEPTELSPGDEVRVRSELGEPDKKTRGARVRLVYVNSYRYEDTDSDGDRTTRTRHEEIVVAQEPLSGAGENGGAAAGAVETVLRASFQTANNRLNWYVEVFVDRKLRGDPTGRLEVVVHRPA